MKKAPTEETLLSHRHIERLDRAGAALALADQDGEPSPFEVPELEEWMQALERDDGKTEA